MVEWSARGRGARANFTASSEWRRLPTCRPNHQSPLISATLVYRWGSRSQAKHNHGTLNKIRPRHYRVGAPGSSTNPNGRPYRRYGHKEVFIGIITQRKFKVEKEMTQRPTHLCYIWYTINYATLGRVHLAKPIPVTQSSVQKLSSASLQIHSTVYRF